MSSTENKAVFLSYASQDAEAARRICEALRSGGVEVWFDADGGLEHGDEWDAKIRKQIKECVLFIPIISANTQARLEGYFRIEWDLAAERARGIASGVPFILPVVIDETREPEALVPDRFRMVQWTKLPDGVVALEVKARYLKLWSHRIGAVKHESEVARVSGSVGWDDTGQETRSKVGRRVPAVAWIGALVASAALIGFFVLRPKPSPAVPTSARTNTTAAATPTEAGRLLQRARDVLGNIDALESDLRTVADQLEQAGKLDPANPEIWAEWAFLDCRYIYDNYDSTPARRDAAHRHATQAINLDPRNASARLAQSMVIRWIGRSHAANEEARKILEQLAAESPRDSRVVMELGWVFMNDGQPEAALKWFARAAESPGTAALAHFGMAMVHEYQGDRWSECLVELDRALALQPAATFLLWKTYLLTIWEGDTKAARTALERVPERMFVEDMPAATRYSVELFSRNFTAAAAAIAAVPRDYLASTGMSGPAGYFKGEMLRRASKPALAEIEFRSALAVVERKLEAAPRDELLLCFKTLLQARLGDRAAAEKTWGVLRELDWPGLPWAAELLVAMEPPEHALDWLEQRFTKGGAEVCAAVLRLNPVYDPLRASPRFAALLERAEADSRHTPHPRAASATAAAGKPPPSDKSVAVLAFDNRSDDKDAEYFSDGISEELINALGRVPGLTVKGRTSAFFFKGKTVTAQEIGEKLGVNYLVRGSVRKVGGKVRITAQLSRAATDEVVWSSESLERDLKDVFAVQDEIAGLIATNLSLKLGASSTAATASVNPQAFELYLQGREAWNRRTREGYDRAEALFTKAVEVDANFARAYAGLADVFDLRAVDNGEIGRWTQRNAEVFRIMHGVLDRALALDPWLADVQASLGDAFFDEWKPAEAIKALRRSVELNPNYATGWHWLGEVLLDRGEMDEALACLRRAVELEPFSLAIAVEYSRCCRMAGRLSEALEFSGRALRLHPNAPRALSSHALTLIDLSRTSEALPLVRTLLQTDAGREQWQTGMAVVRAGLTSESDELLARFRRDGRIQLTAPMLAARGSKEAFLEAWQQLPMVTSEPWYLWEPFVDDFRKDPRFLRVLEQTGLTEAHARAKAWRAAHPTEKPAPKK